MTNALKQSCFILQALLLLSCQSNKSDTETLQQDNVQKQNIIDEQQKQIARLEQRLNSLETKSNSHNTNSSFENGYNSASYATQYYFIVLEVVENHVMDKRKMFYTTQVNQISNYSENTKYKLLDEVVSSYKNSPSARVYEGDVKKRNIYLFGSYEEASKAREKYIMN